MRTYGPIWTKLKLEKTVQVTANRRLHPRIVKAVTKEKWLDIAYKLELSPKYTVMYTSSSGAILTFKLVEKIPMSEIYRYL